MNRPRREHFSFGATVLDRRDAEGAQDKDIKNSVSSSADSVLSVVNSAPSLEYSPCGHAPSLRAIGV